MDVAVHSRSRTRGKIFAVYGVASGVCVTDSPHGQTARFPAHISLGNSPGRRKSSVLQAFVDPVHDFFPDYFVIGCAALHRLPVVIAAPDPHGIIRRVTYKPQILVVGGGSAFSRGRHGGRSCFPPCGAYHGHRKFARSLQYVSHGVGQEKRRLLLQGLMTLRLLLQEHIAVMVQDPGKKGGSGVHSSCPYGCKGGGQFQVGHAVGDPSQGRGRIVILLRQGGDAQVPGVPHPKLGRNRVHHTADRHDIHGICDGLPDVGVSVISSVPVAEFLFPRRVGPVIVNRGQGSILSVQGRGKGGDDLEDRTGLPERIRGPVQGPAGRLFSPSSADGQYLPCMLIHKHKRGLRLYHHGQILSLFPVSFSHDIVFKQPDILFQRLFILITARLFSLELCLKKCLQILFRIMGQAAVFMSHRQPVICGPGYSVIMTGIIDLLVHDLLHGHVLGGIDGQAAGIDHLPGQLPGITQLFRHGVRDLADDLIREVAVGCGFCLCLHIHILDAGIDIILQSLFFLLCRDHPLGLHIIQDSGPAGPVFLRPCKRVKPGRIFCDPGQHGALGQSQVF